MCTVTFWPRKTGYALAMNRDEKLSRVPGLPPQTFRERGRAAICPSEPGGGTWIALNDAGATTALINWYSIPARVTKGPVSRGEVVHRVRMARTPEECDQTIRELPLAKMNPFRLIGIFPTVKEVVEWRWNLRRLKRVPHSWRLNQWISSGFDEPQAQRIRSRTFRSAIKQSTAGSLTWLRRLHRSHSPDSGPFSICMHRADAATVSYTEVVASAPAGVLRHHIGTPCRLSSLFEHRLRLVTRKAR